MEQQVVAAAACSAHILHDNIDRSLATTQVSGKFQPHFVGS